VEIQSERHQQTLVVSLAGSFDALTADQVQRTIAMQFDGGQQQIVLDLSQLDFMSSSGVRVLVDTVKRSRGLDGGLRLAAPQPGVRRTLEIAGLVRILQVYPSVEEAVRSFGPHKLQDGGLG
jgi:anti-anti-sigma factor